ncbi:MAG: alpha/beta hydrolase domain-containing protein, partial [Chloroflexota bacterium]
VSLLRFATAGNPCAGQLDYAIAFGASQTGRFLRQLLYLGFCEDEAGRLAIDGVLPHIAGSRLIESNWRFGQPSYNAADSLSCTFPYTDADQTDPLTGRTDGLLHRARERGMLPKVMHVNSSCEYWASQAALVHTAMDGSADAAIPSNVRVYHFAGTQHGAAPVAVTPAATLNGRGEYPANSIDYRPLLRAAIANLEAWVRTGTEPPASCHPNLASGTLVTRQAAARQLAGLPGPGVPDHLPPFARLDMGPGAEEQRQASRLPPRFAERLPELVAATDADGNELGGLRHPDVSVPLATYTGWNPHRGPDGTTSLLSLTGATIPLPPTAAARAASGDPRPAISERYPSREAFVEQLRAAATELVSQRYLLPKDVDLLVSRSASRYDRLTAP